VRPHLIDATTRSSEVRKRRAQFKREVKAGEIEISTLLVKTAGGVPWWLVDLPIAQMLSAEHGVSFNMACSLCEGLGIPPLKTVGQMTYRQRRVVAAEVAKRWKADEKANPTQRGTRDFGRPKFAGVPSEKVA